MSSIQLTPLAADAPLERIIRAVNEHHYLLSGVNGARIRLVGYDGDERDPNGGTITSSGHHQLFVRSESGDHLLIQHSSGSPDLMEVTDAGVAFGSLTVDDLIVTDTATITTLDVSGLSTLNTLTATGAAQFDSTVTIGNGDTDAHVLVGLFRAHNAADTKTALFIDTTAPRVIVGSGTALSSAANDVFSVRGGIAWFEGASAQSSIAVRYGSGVTSGYYIGATNSATPSLILKDTSGDEVAAFGDSADTYQFVLTGKARISQTLELVNAVDPPTVNGMLTRASICNGWAYATVSGTTPTLQADYNVSGIVRDFIGAYTISWDRDFSSANYAAVAVARSGGIGALAASINTQSAGSVQIACYDMAGALVDPSGLSVCAFGVLS